MHPSSEAPEGSAEDEAPSGLLDRIMRRGLPLVVAALLGLLFLVSQLISIAREPWELDAHSPVVESIDSACGPFRGAVVTIEVEGRRYKCGGSDDKCIGDEPLPAVAYDPTDPSRCRVAASVDRLGFLESWVVSGTCSAALFLIAGVSYLRSAALRRADLLDGTATRQRRRARLRTLSAVTLIAALVVSPVTLVLLLLVSPP